MEQTLNKKYGKK